ncbi:KpsF/GutQ family sugar-phosphate isomerase [Rhizomicrobium electricum]|uniref:KpsF/GutQ family sugar-phosphate isomerase n=1 Tax=Rhizomicrobium electricum TaxID=480070 RepID=A0ABP3PR33_9PROT|nr:KpsF/GutQ family sugar-phosphate isomerase [Rhizomicrobium electricum]NIJ46877.1 arabinose-5-phosphate isomerase [Rhizomicrobium electricum]
MGSAVLDDVAPAAGDLAVAHRVIEVAGEAVRLLGDSLGPEFTKAVDILLAAKGRVIVSGIGKSGHIARKIAATMASTGTPAHFVHPSEASHGDLGEITRNDALLVLSWRGETRELSDLIVYAKRFRIPLIGMAWNADSTLLKAADVALVLPHVSEACPHGLAPTTSTTLMIVLGDALAMALMERRDFSVDEYRNLHPGGSLGRALIRVQDLMHGPAELPLAAEATPLREAIAVMEKHNFGCIGITGADGALVGIVTDGDLRRRFDQNLKDAKASDVMTKSPKIVRTDQLAAEAVALMNDKQITQLFVLDPKAKVAKPVGILHIHDCLRAGLR